MSQDTPNEAAGTDPAQQSRLLEEALALLQAVHRGFVSEDVTDSQNADYLSHDLGERIAALLRRAGRDAG